MVNGIETEGKKSSCLLLLMGLLLFSTEALSQKAVSFGSSGDFIEVPHSPSLALSEFTVEFWLKVRELGDPDMAGGEQTILDKRDDVDQTGYNLRLAGTSFPLPIFAFVLPGGVGSDELIHRNLWYYIAVTQDQDSLRMYLDGELIRADANSYAFDTDVPLRIGEFLGYPGAYLGLRGDIDELRIWDYARSQSAVQSAMHEKLTGSESGLAAYWDFDSISEGMVPDLSPNGNDGSLNGDTILVDSDVPVGPISVPPTIWGQLKSLFQE